MRGSLNELARRHWVTAIFALLCVASVGAFLFRRFSRLEVAFAISEAIPAADGTPDCAPPTVKVWTSRYFTKGDDAPVRVAYDAPNPCEARHASALIQVTSPSLSIAPDAKKKLGHGDTGAWSAASESDGQKRLVIDALAPWDETQVISNAVVEIQVGKRLEDWLLLVGGGVTAIATLVTLLRRVLRGRKSQGSTEQVPLATEVRRRSGTRKADALYKIGVAAELLMKAMMNANPNKPESYAEAWAKVREFTDLVQSNIVLLSAEMAGACRQFAADLIREEHALNRQFDPEAVQRAIDLTDKFLDLVRNELGTAGLTPKRIS